MKTKCKKCGNEYIIKESFLGKEVTCPKCEGKFFASEMEEYDGKEVSDISKNITDDMVEKKDVYDLKNLRIKALRKSVLRYFLIILGVFTIIYIVVELALLHQKISDIPSSQNTFIQAKKFLKSYGNLMDKNKTEFSSQYSFATISKWKRHYRIDSKVKTKVLSLGTVAEIPFSVDMEYQGNNEWRFLSCRYLMDELREFPENSENESSRPKLIITPFPHRAPIPE